MVYGVQLLMMDGPFMKLVWLVDNLVSLHIVSSLK